MTDQLSEITLVYLILAAMLAVVISKKRPILIAHLKGREVISLGMIAVFTLISLPVIDAILPWIEFADLTYNDEVGWSGLVKGLLAIWILWRTIDDYNLPKKNDKEFLRVGIYRYIRYPFYTALLCFALSVFLLSQNWLAGTAAILTFGLFYYLRVPVDDEQGLEKYGHAYLEYMTQTGEIFPQISSIKKIDRE